MSSRNRLLEPEIRSKAAIIYKTISPVTKLIKNHDITEIKSFVRDSIEAVPGFKVEYFEIVDDTDLIPLGTKDEMRKDKRYFGCIAVVAGNIRLIDNIEIGLV
jgi:pantoate--beta-alanine ligase